MLLSAHRAIVATTSIISNASSATTQIAQTVNSQQLSAQSVQKAIISSREFAQFVLDKIALLVTFLVNASNAPLDML